MENKKISATLIIAFYNNLRWLKMILAALERQSCRDFEVIVADDGSRDEVVTEVGKLIEQSPLSIRHIWHEDEGWRKNVMLNKAVKSAISDYLIFIDGDCIPHHAFIAEHLMHRAQGRIVAGRRVELPKKESETITEADVRKRFFEYRMTFKAMVASIRREVKYAELGIHLRGRMYRMFRRNLRHYSVIGCNFSLYKSDLEKINGFDERYLQPMIGEDTDVEWRLARIGIYPDVIKNHCIVYHKNHARLIPSDDSGRKLFEETNQAERYWTDFGLSQKNTPSQSQ